MLLLLESPGCQIDEGAIVRVQTRAWLGGAQPRYRFEASMRRQEAQTAQPGGQALHWHPLGRPIEYPDDGLNPNDAMDLLLAQHD